MRTCHDCSVTIWGHVTKLRCPSCQQRHTKARVKVNGQRARQRVADLPPAQIEARITAWEVYLRWARRAA